MFIVADDSRVREQALSSRADTEVRERGDERARVRVWGRGCSFTYPPKEMNKLETMKVNTIFVLELVAHVFAAARHYTSVYIEHVHYCNIQKC